MNPLSFFGQVGQIPKTVFSVKLSGIGFLHVKACRSTLLYMYAYRPLAWLRLRRTARDDEKDYQCRVSHLKPFQAYSMAAIIRTHPPRSMMSSPIKHLLIIFYSSYCLAANVPNQNANNQTGIEVKITWCISFFI